LGQRRGKKKKTITLGREDVFLVHAQNGFNGLILNWCIDGCWFTPAPAPHLLCMGDGFGSSDCFFRISHYDFALAINSC